MSVLNQPTDRPVVGVVSSSPLDVGGVETYVLSLFRECPPERYMFRLYAPAPLARKARMLGVGTILWKTRSSLDAKAALQLRRALRVDSVDLLHIVDPRAGTIGRLVAKSLGIPVVYTVHQPPYVYTTRLKQWLYGHAERLLNARFTDRVIYVSHRVHQEALSLEMVAPEKAVVIPNGIVMDSYVALGHREATRRALSAPDDVPIVCCIGRLSAEKGVDVLLTALSMVIEQTRAFRVWIVGDGPLRSALEAQTREMGAADLVRFLGFRDDVPKLLQGCDVFVLPSRNEAMSLALLEAMGAGLPCVVTDVGDSAEMVRDHAAGFVVPSQASDALAVSLTRLLLDPELRCSMGNAARERARRYDIRETVHRVLDVYDAVLADTPSLRKV